MEEPVYCTRESVMAAPDIRPSAYAESAIDDAIVAGARAVDRLLHRIFYPWQGTRTFDWPGTYRLWFDEPYPDLISFTNVTSGGTIITSSVLAEPVASGPPYTHADIDRSGNNIFTYVNGTGQRSLNITGLWGYRNDERQAGTLTSSISSSATVVRYTPGARVVGVGATLRMGTERMLVNGKRWVDSTQTASLANSAAAVSMSVTNGAAFLAGEELLLDAERLLVVAVAGNTVMVKRAWGGSVLAAHAAAAIYWARDLEVTRGALGTTAAAGTAGDAVYVHIPPALVTQLNRAYALDTGFQEGSGYARTVASGDAERNASGQGIRALEERVYGAYGRRYRMRAI